MAVPDRQAAAAAPAAVATPPADANASRSRPTQRPAPAIASAAAHVAPPPVIIDKAVRLPTPRERANAEYARGVAALRQGHADVAAAALRAAIAEDAAWTPPRQALLGILLEQRRLDEAETLLRQGMAENPGQIDFAVQLARLQVERGHYDGALDTLQPLAALAAGNADYLGLKAAVLQRLGRHREAAAAYQEGLRLAPQNGVWWMGLGLSLEAEGHAGDAAEAYRRARDSGTLSADLAQFVEQKLAGTAAR